MKKEGYKDSMYYKIKKRGYIYMTKNIVEKLLDESYKKLMDELKLKDNHHFPGIQRETNGKLSFLLMGKKYSYKVSHSNKLSLFYKQKGEKGGFTQSFDTVKQLVEFVKKMEIQQNKKNKNQINDVKLGQDDKLRIWKEYRKGKFDWRRLSGEVVNIELWYTDFTGQRQLQPYISDIQKAMKRVEKHYASEEAGAVIDVHVKNKKGEKSVYHIYFDGKWKSL
jgi:hypothetical protein